MAKTLEERVKELEKKVDDMEVYRMVVEELALRFGFDLKGNFVRKKEERDKHGKRSEQARERKEETEKR